MTLSPVQTWTPSLFPGACNLRISQQTTGGYRQKVSTKKLWANIIHCGRQAYKDIGSRIIVNGAKKSFRANNERTVCEDILTKRESVWKLCKHAGQAGSTGAEFSF